MLVTYRMTLQQLVVMNVSMPGNIDPRLTARRSCVLIIQHVLDELEGHNLQPRS